MSENGFIFITDTLNHRIQKFDIIGNYISQWDTPGGAPEQFAEPKGIVLNTNGYLYITDSLNNRIQKFNVLGNLIDE
ncbi:MAG: hypothetical protein GY869_06975, partial [Planctomycetes bacterium]|nr:hypothetical protein [Planctomycetota bacterium]